MSVEYENLTKLTDQIFDSLTPEYWLHGPWGEEKIWNYAIIQARTEVPSNDDELIALLGCIDRSGTYFFKTKGSPKVTFSSFAGFSSEVRRALHAMNITG